MTVEQSSVRDAENPSQDLPELPPLRVLHAADESWRGLVRGSQEQAELLAKYIDRSIDRSTDLGHDGIDAALNGAGDLAAWLRANIEAIVATGFRIGDAVEQLTDYAGEFARHRMEDSADSLKAFSRADSVSDFIARQQSTTLRNLEHLRDDSSRLAELLPALGSEILHPVTDRVGATLQGLQISVPMNDIDDQDAA